MKDGRVLWPSDPPVYQATPACFAAASMYCCRSSESILNHLHVPPARPTCTPWRRDRRIFSALLRMSHISSSPGRCMPPPEKTSCPWGFLVRGWVCPNARVFVAGWRTRLVPFSNPIPPFQLATCIYSRILFFLVYMLYAAAFLTEPRLCRRMNTYVWAYLASDHGIATAKVLCRAFQDPQDRPSYAYNISIGPIVPKYIRGVKKVRKNVLANYFLVPSNTQLSIVTLQPRLPVVTVSRACGLGGTVMEGSNKDACLQLGCSEAEGRGMRKMSLKKSCDVCVKRKRSCDGFGMRRCRWERKGFRDAVWCGDASAIIAVRRCFKLSTPVSVSWLAGVD